MDTIVEQKIEQVDIIKALVAFQGDLKAAKLDEANDHFGSRYATLASVWEAIRPGLKANGLCVIQRPASSVDGLSLTTTVMHVSGQSISSTFSVPIVKRDPQGMGSAMTYAKRYGLCAMLGIVADGDDDGNAAAASGGQQQQGRQQSQQRRPATGKPALENDRVSAEQLRELMDRWASSQNEGVVDKPEFIAFAQMRLASKADLSLPKSWTKSMVENLAAELGDVSLSA